MNKALIAPRQSPKALIADFGEVQWTFDRRTGETSLDRELTAIRRDWNGLGRRRRRRMWNSLVEAQPSVEALDRDDPVIDRSREGHAAAVVALIAEAQTGNQDAYTLLLIGAHKYWRSITHSSCPDLTLADIVLAINTVNADADYLMTWPLLALRGRVLREYTRERVRVLVRGPKAMGSTGHHTGFQNPDGSFPQVPWVVSERAAIAVSTPVEEAVVARDLADRALETLGHLVHDHTLQVLTTYASGTAQVPPAFQFSTSHASRHRKLARNQLRATVSIAAA